MGLAPNDGSLHYVQRDGYAHAADLRTAGRGELKNRLVQAYFWSMGFATLRDVGTGDHLHVELPVRGGGGRRGGGWVRATQYRGISPRGGDPNCRARKASWARWRAVNPWTRAATAV